MFYLFLQLLSKEYQYTHPEEHPLRDRKGRFGDARVQVRFQYFFTRVRDGRGGGAVAQQWSASGTPDSPTPACGGDAHV